MKSKGRLAWHGGGSGPGGARAFFMGLAVLFLVCCFGCTNPLLEGEDAPSFQLKGLDGGSVSLAELKGKVVVLHFWATWCPPCLEELPQLLSFFRKQDPARFVLLTVNVDAANPGRAKEFLRSWGLEPSGYLDPGGKLARRYGTIRFPETYILDSKGTLRKKLVGAADWMDPYWERFLHSVHDGVRTPGESGD